VSLAFDLLEGSAAELCASTDPYLKTFLSGRVPSLVV
jgi:hypothetical protein